MEGRCPIEENGIFPDNFIQGIPNLWPFLLDHLLGTFNGINVPTLLELVINKRLEKLQGHLFG